MFQKGQSHHSPPLQLKEEKIHSYTDKIKFIRSPMAKIASIEKNYVTGKQTLAWY